MDDGFILGADDSGRRLDRIMRKCFSDMPLSAIHKAFRKGRVRINGEAKDPDYRCHEGERLQVSTALVHGKGAQPECRTASKPESSSFNDISEAVLLETDDLLFLNKPAGLLVHDGPESLEAAVRHLLASRLAPSLSFLPGPLHRLDRNTSGVIAFSKSLRGAQTFSKALGAGKIHRSYLAVMEGDIGGSARWEDRLGRDSSSRTSSRGDEEDPLAITDIEPVACAGNLSLARLTLLTGRTHQIRAQASLHGHPLAGDKKYGSRAARNSYFLHAECISFEVEPLPGLPSMVRAPLPSSFAAFVASVFALDTGAIARLHPAVYPRRDLNG